VQSSLRRYYELGTRIRCIIEGSIGFGTLGSDKTLDGQDSGVDVDRMLQGLRTWSDNRQSLLTSGIGSNVLYELTCKQCWDETTTLAFLFALPVITYIRVITQHEKRTKQSGNALSTLNVIEGGATLASVVKGGHQQKKKSRQNTVPFPFASICIEPFPDSITDRDSTQRPETNELGSARNCRTCLLFLPHLDFHPLSACSCSS
jgi:hypothetical protein